MQVVSMYIIVVYINAYSVPTSLPVGWTQPSNFIGYPAVANTPQLVVLSNSFRNIVGINSGTYPSPQQTSTYFKLSDFTPPVSPVQSFILSCSLLNNQYSNPRTILYSFSPAGTTFGSLIQSSPNQFSFIDIMSGNYSDFTIQFLDQSFNPLQIQDTNLVVMLLIKSGNKNAISY